MMPRYTTVQADALFASALQRSDEPSRWQIRQAIAAAMRWARTAVADAFGDTPARRP